jgi:hypothetical protein
LSTTRAPRFASGTTRPYASQGTRTLVSPAASERPGFASHSPQDESGDGKLTVNEFFEWSLKRSKVGGAAILEKIFHRYDSDGGCSLNADEFKRMACDLGFGHTAQEVFAVLDHDRSGSITFKEMLKTLRTTTPRNMDTKKMLFGCIWSWGMDESNKGQVRQKVNASKWRIRSDSHPAVYHELRALLNDSGAHVYDLAMLFDEDVSAKVTIDQLEFVKVLKKKLGFRGMPHVLDEVLLDLALHWTATETR